MDKTEETHQRQHSGDVLTSLDQDQLVAAKRRRLPRRYLKPSEVWLLWGLRAYLVFMMGIVIYRVLEGPK